MSTTDALTLNDADWGRGATVRLGVVAEADYEAARVRVRISGEPAAEGEEKAEGEALTGWVPWGTWAAGHLRVWSPPAIGEQCVVLAPSGDLGQSIAMPAVFQQRVLPAPSKHPDHTVLAWDDGGFIRYERDTHCLYLSAPEAIYMHADRLIKITAARVEIN